MTTKPEPTLENLKWAIVKAETECPHCGDANWPGHCPYISDCACGKRSGEVDCGKCKGTGRVPRFPELREECSQQGGYVWNKRHKNNLLSCYLCHGLGYVPLWSKPEDLATWQGTLGVAILQRYDPQSKEALQYENNLWAGDIPSTFKAATEALGIEIEQEV